MGAERWRAAGPAARRRARGRIGRFTASAPGLLESSAAPRRPPRTPGPVALPGARAVGWGGGLGAPRGPGQGPGLRMRLARGAEVDKGDLGKRECAFLDSSSVARQETAARPASLGSNQAS